MVALSGRSWANGFGFDKAQRCLAFLPAEFGTGQQQQLHLPGEPAQGVSQRGRTGWTIDAGTRAWSSELVSCCMSEIERRGGR